MGSRLPCAENLRAGHSFRVHFHRQLSKSSSKWRWKELNSLRKVLVLEADKDQAVLETGDHGIARHSAKPRRVNGLASNITFGQPLDISGFQVVALRRGGTSFVAADKGDAKIGAGSPNDPAVMFD
ncbi:hypothetical protein HAP41_0000016400 [Bradyrhizobium barranii subsp. apii]|uniref:Uncharacterized protein n=1 Tax=Bradyrhizobium barranii subsp. apii TaxID=2819348 RepID=A0A8T5VG37_9BRAD|nr:hypothetical protein [Bradyrhizobium barranii]UPT90369.1 hypothetical protein HAP41_0000016400 [Bradyrhizobium barranii subsp. apii]